jgi:hypothetical protein
VVPVFRTRDGASALADALAARAARAKRRTVVAVVGDATLRPGQATTITDLPGDPGGDLRIIAVEHTLSSETGLITSLTVEPAS